MTYASIVKVTKLIASGRMMPSGVHGTVRH